MGGGHGSLAAVGPPGDERAAQRLGGRAAGSAGKSGAARNGVGDPTKGATWLNPSPAGHRVPSIGT
ncbi:hypothetical protein GCM10009635_11060 [Actinocatenispora thailandica]